MIDVINVMDAAMQRRIVCFLLILLFIAIETMFYVGDEEHSDSKMSYNMNANNNNVILNTIMPNNNATYEKFGFYIMGDTPYAKWEDSMLQFQMQELKHQVRDHMLFTVHVGDIQKVQRTNCSESHYQHVADVLRAGPLPTLVIPGDNDWFDCPDREASFSHFSTHLTGLDRDWNHQLPLVRHAKHPELFAMEQNGILFLSIHLINAPIKDESPNLWADRMQRNQDWVTHTLDAYFSKSSMIRGVVVLGHSLRSPRTRPFFEFLATHFVRNRQRLKIPVVYLHGDGHDWDVDYKFNHQLGWKYFYDVQVDQGAKADPCIVEFAKQVNGKMIPLRLENDNQLLLGRGLVRIDRQRGRYTDEYLKDWAASQ